MIFDAVMTEGSITRASERLAMTQPAVSNAVSRMRHVWKDELFVKDGRNIQPTLYAQNLWREIREPLEMLNNAVTPDVFEPETSTRTFKIALADAVVDIAWKELRQTIENEAPLINIHAIPYTIVNGEQVLIDAEVDMVIGASNAIVSPVILSEHLFKPEYLVIMRKHHPLAKCNLGLKEFADAPHLLVSLSGDVTGFTDQVLAQQGLKRRIAMSVNHFAAVGELIKTSDLIAVVPPTAVEKAIFSGDIIAMKPPIEINVASVSCMWHKRQQKDGGLCWLRQKLVNIIKMHAEEHYQKLGKLMKTWCD